MLKWAFCPILGARTWCKTPTPIWDKNAWKMAAAMGQNDHYGGKTPQFGTQPSFLHNNGHNQ